MAAAKNDAHHNGVGYEELYQPTLINVNGVLWERFGYGLIGGSTFIMAFQMSGVGPAWFWKRADDVTTILFTFELLVRIFEKGYLFFTEEEKNWNFFDTMVVAISLFSMVISAKAAQDASQGHGSSSNTAMNKMKVLRTLRLLRLLRLFRCFKGIEKVNAFVDIILSTGGTVFLILIGICALLVLTFTAAVAVFAGSKAWLRAHKLPQMPKFQ